MKSNNERGHGNATESVPLFVVTTEQETSRWRRKFFRSAGSAVAVALLAVLTVDTLTVGVVAAFVVAMHGWGAHKAWTKVRVLTVYRDRAAAAARTLNEGKFPPLPSGAHDVNLFGLIVARMATFPTTVDETIQFKNATVAVVRENERNGCAGEHQDGCFHRVDRKYWSTVARWAADEPAAAVK